MNRRRIECSSGFFLLLAFLNYMDRQFVVPQVLLACLIHELGHIVALRAMNVKIARIRLTAAGAEITVEQSMNYHQEGIAALAGPGANFLTAVILSTLSVLEAFSLANLALGCFNLLPVRQLDGGRALLATLSLILNQDRAERVGERLNHFFLFLMIPFGFFAVFKTGNPSALFIALWLCLVQKKGKKTRNSTCHTIQKQVK